MEQVVMQDHQHGDATVPEWWRQEELNHSSDDLADLLFRMAEDDGGHLFAIVDAAAHKHALAAMAGSHWDYEPLFTSRKMAAYMAAGPFLVQFAKEDGLPQWFADEAWGTASVVFFTSPAPRTDLVRHLQGCLGAVTPDDRELIFRYYDPRILRCYLPSCMQAEAWRMMGPICRFMLETENGLGLHVFDRSALSAPPDRDDPVWKQPIFLRADQMTALRCDVERRFCRQMHTHLSGRFAGQISQRGLDDVALGNLISAGLKRARMYGVRRDFDVRRYLEYMLILDPDFDIAPGFEWAAAILFNQDLGGRQKMDRLDRFAALQLLGSGAMNLETA